MDIKRLKDDVQKYADSHGGKIYSPIDNPHFKNFVTHHGPDRFDPIASNIPNNMHTALDIGTHWGFFAHKLESLGLSVTATEIVPLYIDFLERLRELYNDNFVIYPKSVFTLPGEVKYDVVLALNIFHHFIKKEDEFGVFKEFLSRLNCKVIFFQAHDPREGQMKDAYKNFPPEEFCEFIIKNTPNKSIYTEIGQFGTRPMYVIS